jgi:hypothetical protein
MDRIPPSERTRERLKSLMEGHGERGDLPSELVRLSARLIIEEGLEGEATHALGLLLWSATERSPFASSETPGFLGKTKARMVGFIEEARILVLASDSKSIIR